MAEAQTNPDIVECNVCYGLVVNRTASRLAHDQYHRMQVSPTAFGMYLNEKEKEKKQTGFPGVTD